MRYKAMYKPILLMLFSIAVLFATPAFSDDMGRFTLTFHHTKDKVYNDIAYLFDQSHQFQDIIVKLNDDFVLPVDVKVQFADEDGPVYDPNTRTITMSYDFVLYLSALYLERYPDATDEEMIRFALRSTIFLFYHEVGHSLIDIYELPVVSNEETAADNLAVIIGLEYTKDGYDVVMDSAELFDILDQTHKNYDEDDLSDEHVLDSQRFYNIICLTYGKYPEKVQSEIEDLHNKKLLHFIKEKGEYCKDEYQRQLNAWLKLLEPHLQP